VYRSDRCRSTGRCHRCWQLFRLPAITIGAIPATWKTLIRGTHRRSSPDAVGYGVDGVVELSVLLKEADDHGTHGDDSPSVGLRGLHGFTDENRCKTSALTSR